MPDTGNHDETESVGAPLIRLAFSSWDLAPPFERFRNAPVVDFENVASLSAEGSLLDRRGSHVPKRRPFIRAAFSSRDEFGRVLAAGELVFMHVFERQPDGAMLKLLAENVPNERIFLFDTTEDAGFLRSVSAPVGVQIGTPKSLLEMRGVGAWVDGVLVGFEENIDAMAAFFATTRRAISMRK